MIVNVLLGIAVVALIVALVRYRKEKAASAAAPADVTVPAASTQDTTQSK